MRLLESSRLKRRFSKCLDVLQTDGLPGLMRFYRLWHHRENRLAFMPALPRQISIEVTSYCNLRCPMCPRTIELELLEGSEELRAKYSISKARIEDLNHHMETATFAKIIERLPFVREILLFCPQGESVLHPDFCELMRLAGRATGRKIMLTTNATTLNEERARAVAEHAYSVCFSIDGGDAETYERIRIGSDFERTMSNLEEFMQIRGNRKLPILLLNYVVQSDNLDSIPQMFKRLKRIGYPVITFLEPHMRYEHLAEKFELTDAERARVVAYAEEGRALGLNVRHTPRIPHHKRVQMIADGVANQNHSECLAPWRTPHIALNGDVTPCWYAPFPQMLRLGNVIETPFEEIWNGPAYQQLRRGHMQGETTCPPEFCMHCSHFLYGCSMPVIN